VALERAHVVLGAFGMTAKAGRVVPHKVYQGAAAGRAVVTGDAPALREVFTPRIHLWSVPRGDAAALAEALALMIRDPATRARLGERARVRALEIGTPEKIGAGLAVDLDTLVSR
jgi:glycosyltransferase involved in cell wall biosynthesis